MVENQNGHPFELGDLVRTVKGAKFWGKIISFDNDPDSHPGATVLAIDPRFHGTKHVYPLKQLEACPASPSLYQALIGAETELRAVRRQRDVYSEIAHAVGVARDHAGFVGTAAECIHFQDEEIKRLTNVLKHIKERADRGGARIETAMDTCDEISGMVRAALK